VIYIYTLSHPETGEVRYVGKTNNLKERWKSHKNESLRYNRVNHKEHWIKKLLREGLTPKLEVLDEIDSDDWGWLEVYWIAQCKAWGFRLTNMTDGGEDPPSWKGKTHTPEHCAKLSDRMTKNNPYHKLTPEQHAARIEAARLAIKGKPNETARLILSKPVNQYTLSGEYIKTFNSATEAAKIVGLANPTNISNCCVGVRGKAGGYQWRHAISGTTNISQYKRKVSVTPNTWNADTFNKRILQYDLDGKYLKTWKSITEAEMVLGLCGVGEACSGKKNRCGNFQWRYYEDGFTKEIDPYNLIVSNRGRKVRQLTTSGEIIQEWVSAKKAANSLGMANGGRIQQCCIGKSHTSGGYMWEYVNN
jgi:hypothetical protein